MHVYDISASACNAVKNNSISVCTNQNEVADKSDFIITMLPNNDIVSKTYETIVNGGVGNGKTFIDSSTIDPNVAKSVSID